MNRLNLGSRGSQTVLASEFTFDYNDGVYPMATATSPRVVVGAGTTVTDLGSKVRPSAMPDPRAYTANTNASTTYFEAMHLPLGAVVQNIELLVEIAYVGPTTATLALSTRSGQALLGATSLAAVARTVGTVPVAVASNDPGGPASTHAGMGADVIATLVLAGGAAATAGRARVRITYTVNGRLSEVYVI